MSGPGTSSLSARILWTAFEAAAATGGHLGAVGEAAAWDAERLPEEDWAATGLSIDTRTLRPGDIFVAVRDARDGHDFVPDAFAAGASAALVSKAPMGAPKDKPLLIVPEALGGTMHGLHGLAAAARDRCFGKLIAVTGSAGKTSVKEMLRAALTPCGEVHAAAASFNNHLGVPLTLAALPGSARYGVFEIGMNHPGEITPLVKLVWPHVAVITTVAAAHLEFFSSVEEIAAAKAEILTGLRRGGVAVLPADNPYFSFLRAEAERNGVARIVPFGETAEGEGAVRLLSCMPEASGSKVTADVAGREVSFVLSAPGRHQAVNATAVLAAALAAGADLDRVVRGLETFRAGGGRGARHEVTLGGARVTLIDESYNANPASMAASLRVLGEANPSDNGRRIAVLGEMRELGRDGAKLHAALAEPVQAAQVDLVHTAGEGMLALRDALPEAKRGVHAAAALSLADDLTSTFRDGDVVLFKGSNASRVGALLSELLSRAEGAAA
ncbi:UDP-N-acetylmuramoyl-tripeptide--D-alanyl-D-alanine ligase [Parvularcula dongshanensis]|uniref:UDP-N-acetylmuramoyl-tripeptide--D-alanyl-D-alanine ligase n=1 Tax=Parvularcula dongshanensis TaxID=1173995 RepID=A0A840I628_9PROT|nr:UDP-N-acetylmuramoyl-tripeptide--D-alanyl-D-alanine ligase [Parvularcula dongshanensis]MBB4659872.1 UDP-N-acetylmuramoyl-tripeptide--D-alanyl-D-alanine ligase [Parvularcula dongshanensis]